MLRTMMLTMKIVSDFGGKGITIHHHHHYLQQALHSSYQRHRSDAQFLIYFTNLKPWLCCEEVSTLFRWQIVDFLHHRFATLLCQASVPLTVDELEPFFRRFYNFLEETLVYILYNAQFANSRKNVWILDFWKSYKFYSAPRIYFIIL